MVYYYDIAVGLWVLLAIVILILAVVWAFLVSRHRDAREEHSVVPLVLVGATLLVAVVSESFILADYHYQTNHVWAIYDLRLETEGQGAIVVPASNSSELMGRLRVTSGEGTLEEVSTAHGRGLRLEFDGPVIARARVESMNPIEDADDLTLSFDGNEYWVHLGSSEGNLSPVRIELRLEYGGRFWDHGIHLSCEAVEGWNTYEARERQAGG